MALIQVPNYCNVVQSTSIGVSISSRTNICNPLNALKKLMLQSHNLLGALLPG